MIEILENLKTIGDELEKSGQVKSAQAVTNTMQSLSQLKTAQYEGVQGYWIRNRRCWDNCYRQKRTASPTRPAQEVWFDCWDEYLKSINDNNSGWEKYAGDEKVVKTADSEDAKHFCEETQKRVKAGTPIPNAVYGVIEQATLVEKSLNNVNNLLKVAEHLEKIGKKELSQKVYDACFDIIKEGQGYLWQPRGFSPYKGKGFWGSVGQGLKDIGTGRFKDRTPGATSSTFQKRLQERLRLFIDQATELKTSIDGDGQRGYLKAKRKWYNLNKSALRPPRVQDVDVSGPMKRYGPQGLRRMRKKQRPARPALPSTPATTDVIQGTPAIPQQPQVAPAPAPQQGFLNAPVVSGPSGTFRPTNPAAPVSTSNPPVPSAQPPAPATGAPASDPATQNELTSKINNFSKNISEEVNTLAQMSRNAISSQDSETQFIATNAMQTMQSLNGQLQSSLAANDWQGVSNALGQSINAVNNTLAGLEQEEAPTEETPIGVEDNADTFSRGFDAAAPPNVTQAFDNIVSQVNAGTIGQETGKYKLWEQVVDLYIDATGRPQ